jgi:hypothetical protein
MDIALGNRLIELRARIAAGFDANNWDELGLLTGQSGLINSHPRLLRSLSWGDEDYDGNVLEVLRRMVESDFRTLPIIQTYVDERFPGEGEYISAKPSERRITFAPNVFHVPEGTVELDLVAVMMPFGKEFGPVYEAIKRACASNGLRCLRADDIWEESAIIQDIFNLLFKAQVVVVDFSTRNSNVMYETGIAHTLGKHVIPLTQSLSDVPFDMQHHRALKYFPNTEGLGQLEGALARKLAQFALPSPTSPPVPPPSVPGGDDIPF